MTRNLLILTLISYLLTGFVSKARVMRLRFETPTEDNTIVSYVVARSTTGIYWTTVKTIKANKRPSVYEYDLPFNYGYYRIRTNKTRGYFFSKNLYVKK